MKAAIKLHLNTAILAILFLVAFLNGTGQTRVNVKTQSLAIAVGNRFFSTGISSEPNNVTVTGIDPVKWDDKIIGYVFHYKGKGFAVVPVIREINPFFALSSNQVGSNASGGSNEGFLKEELIERYITVSNKKLPATSLKRNEIMWQQLLAEVSL